MNIIKNSSVAYAIGVTEMIYFATQAGEETSMHGTMYLGVDHPLLHLGVRDQPRSPPSSRSAPACPARWERK